MQVRKSQPDPKHSWLIRPRPRSGPRPLLLFALVVGLTALSMTLDSPGNQAVAQSAPVAPAPATPSASVVTRSLEEPLRLIQEARRVYASVRDYQCTFIKQERIDGQLSPENVIQFRARTTPFSVNMLWQAPRSQRGQEACYVAGQNNGRLRARGTGALSLVGFVSLDPQSPRARGASKYSITEAGIGNLIERFAAGWQLEQRLGLTQVRIDLGEFAARPAIRVETTHPTRAPGLLFYRSVVWFDQQTSLPVRVENYDWPGHNDHTAPLAELFNYVDLRLNVGLPDSVFQR